MTDTYCIRCGQPLPCNCTRPCRSFLTPAVEAFVAEHGSGHSPEPQLEGLVDRYGRLWAFNHVADAYTLPPGQTEPLTPQGLGDDISWFGAEERTTYEGLLGPFTEVRI